MPTMNIVLNGVPHETAAQQTIAELVLELNLGEKRFAVEVNEQIIPRGQHQQHRLQEADMVEIVVAIGGG